MERFPFKETSVLVLPIDLGPYLVHCVNSCVGLDTVLVWNYIVVSYMFWQLMPSEENYMGHDLEFGICSSGGEDYLGYGSSDLDIWIGIGHL